MSATLTPQITDIVSRLRDFGITKVPGLTQHDAFDIRCHLRSAPCFNSHVKVYADQEREFSDAEREWQVWCHDMQAAVEAPRFWGLALQYTRVAQHYFCKPPRLYSMNAFWTKPAVEPVQELQTFHRDRDDDQFLALFVYGTDIHSREDGPHVYQCGSHERGSLASRTETVFGPAGTAFIIDPRGLHKGLLPTRGQRLLLWARWGVSETPWAYTNDKLTPLDRKSVLLGRYPEDPYLQKAVELVVR